MLRCRRRCRPLVQRYTTPPRDHRPPKPAPTASFLDASTESFGTFALKCPGGCPGDHRGVHEEVAGVLTIAKMGVHSVARERRKVLYQQTQHDFEPVALIAVRFLPNVELDVHILQRAARHQLPVCAPAEH